MDTFDLVPESTGRTAQSSSATKRGAEPNLDLDEEEPSAKVQAVGAWGSAEDFAHGYIGLFSSGMDGLPEVEREKDMGFLEMLEEYIDEDEGIKSLVNRINILAADRDKTVSPKRPVPAQLDWLDEMRWNDSWYQEYFDTNGNALDSELTEKAMCEEVEYMEELQVWKVLKYCDLLSDDKVIPTNWVLIQKGPDVRARLVACEVKFSSAGGTNADLFAATPPLEVFRALISLAATNRTWCLDFIDVRKAHLNGKSRRRVVVKLPKQAGGGFGVLLRTLYGTRDAANAWAEEIKVLMLNNEFKQGKSSPCLSWHEKKELRAAVHGDDFGILGPWRHILWLRKILEKDLAITFRGSMGPTLGKNVGVRDPWKNCIVDAVWVPMGG